MNIRKIASTVMVGIAGVFFVAGCASDGTKNDPTVVIDKEDKDAAKIAWCAEQFGEYAEALETLAELGNYVVTEADARAYADAAREAVTAGRRGIQECGKYLPASDVAEFNATLDETERLLDELDSLL